jgi:RecA-family ATPase
VRDDLYAFADDDNETALGKLLTLQQLHNLHPPKWLIQDVLPEGGLGMLYGPPGSFKSFVALDWALGLAAKRNQVLYIAAERARGLGKRSEAWMQKREMSYEDLAGLRVYPDPIMLEHPKAALAELQLPGVVFKPRLVVIDTFSLCMEGDENSTQDCAKVVQGIRLLQKWLGGSTVLLVHHTDKQNRYERGSSVMRGAVDTKIEANRVGKTNRLTLKCDKQSDSEEFDDIHLQMVPFASSLVPEKAESETAETIEQIVKDNPKLSARQLMELVRSKGIKAKNEILRDAIKEARQ